MLAGYHIISYVDYSPASYLFLHLPRRMRRGAKAVFHAEGPLALMMNTSRVLRFLFEGIFPRCDAYTGITEFVARDVSRTKEVASILPVGVDTESFIPPAKRENRSPVVLFAGTLIERKGPQHVVEAAAQFPDAVFRIVGAGREGFEQILQNTIVQMGLKNVSLEGPKSQKEMLDIMQDCDIFLLPSRLEGIPKVTLEAAATGLPCIVFRDYETPSVVDGITGFQVASLAEMMQALRRLIGDRSMREGMGKAARKHIEKFDWNLVSRLWQNTYLDLAAASVK
jgi:glycosyltransferase involved in cell wall biosynthesis